MTTTIHHMTKKLADRVNVKLTVEADGSVSGTAGELRVSGRDPKDVLEEVIRQRKAVEENPTQHSLAPVKKVPGPSKSGAGVVTGSVVKKRYKDLYRPHDGTCGDDLTDVLTEYLLNEDGLDRGKFRAVCLANDIDAARWSEYNPGMARMNLGNVLRGRLRNGKNIVIGDVAMTGRKAKQAKKSD